MHPSLQNAHLHPAATAMNRPSKLIQTIVGSHQPVGLKILRLAIGPPIVSERPLAGPVGQPDPGYHRFFAVRPGKDSSSGRMLWRPNFTCFMGPCGQPRAKQHPSTVQAVRNQGCLLLLCALPSCPTAFLHHTNSISANTPISNSVNRRTAQESSTESQLSAVSPLMSQLGAATPGDRNPNADLFFF